jgi:adenine phosphoribosyltransferase
MNDSHESSLARLAALIRDVPDFPKPGIVFKDITPVLADAPALRSAIAHMALPFVDDGIDVVLGIESRGFMFGAPIALELGAGFVPVRKPNKLPRAVERVEYALEYGTDALEMHADALRPGARVLIVDDVLATGGTAAAAAQLVRNTGAELVGAAFFIELKFLAGQAKLGGLRTSSLIVYK